jgi:hypothetical protein
VPSSSCLSVAIAEITLRTKRRLRSVPCYDGRQRPVSAIRRTSTAAVTDEEWASATRTPSCLNGSIGWLDVSGTKKTAVRGSGGQVVAIDAVDLRSVCLPAP